MSVSYQTGTTEVQFPPMGPKQPTYQVSPQATYEPHTHERQHTTQQTMVPHQTVGTYGDGKNCSIHI